MARVAAQRGSDNLAPQGLTNPRERPRRPAFTLTELLVVIALIVFIAAMAAFFMPGFDERERVTSGSSQMQQWLMVAKQTAQLERVPHGLRLICDPKTPNLIFSAQYIAQPEDFNGGTVRSYQDPGTGQWDLTKIVSEQVDITDGFTEPEYWPVQVGDFLQVHGSGLMHQIVNIQPGNPSILQLASPLPYPITMPEKEYRIVRGPRPQAEDPLQLPQGVAIDLTTNTTYSKFTPALPINPGADTKPNTGDEFVDILYSPAGNVMGNLSADRMVFWVREVSGQLSDPNDPKNTPFDGEPRLVVVFTRSGLVTIFDVARGDPKSPTYNPYTKIK